MNANSPPIMLVKILKFTDLKWLKMHSNCTPMVGENFKIY